MTRGQWVVILEAQAHFDGGVMDLVALKQLLSSLADVRAVALHSPDRYALHVHVEGPDEVSALVAAGARWRSAVELLGLGEPRLIRAEVLTHEEFELECDHAREDGSPPPAVVVDAGDAEASARLGERLLWQVFHDPLTRLPGRGLFMNHLEQALAGPRDPDDRLVLVVVKLTGLGQVNRRWGRSAGDDVLAASARQLKRALPGALAAGRISGDELALLLEAGSDHAARSMASAALEAVAEPHLVGGTSVTVSATAGIAFGRRSQGADELVAQARAALHAAGAREARIELYRPGLPAAELLSPPPDVPHDPMGYLMLMQRAAMATNESSSLPQAAGLVVRQVCAHLGWPVGHLYVLSPDGGLEPGGLARLGASLHQPLVDVLDRLTLRPGEGLGGQVLQSGRPAWSTDVPGDGSLPWSGVASACGLTTALAFPVLIGREVVGVLEFFAERARRPDDALVEVLRYVGSQLGRVVERQRSEARFRLSEDRLRDAQGLAHLGSWDAEPPADRGNWTAEMCRILGVADDAPHTLELFMERVHPDDRALVAEASASARSGEPLQLEFRVVRPDGDVRWVSGRTTSVRDETGAIVSMHGTILDITEVKLAEQGLRDRERQLTMAEQVAELGSWELDVASGRIEWSEGMFRLWGVDRGTFEPTVEALVFYAHPEDRDRMRGLMREWPDGAYAAEFRATPPGGTERWFRARATVQHDAGGRPVRLVGTMQDVTKEKRAETELRDSEERYRRVVEWGDGAM